MLTRLLPSALILALLVGCGSPPKKAEAPPDLRQALETKTALYEKLFKGQQDEFGFIETDACDSLIFTGISNPGAKLTAAEIEPGRWIRRPAAYPECWSNGLSRSDISRDGLLGVIWWAIENKDSAVLLRLWKYGEKHNWVMGERGWEHAVFAPTHISMLAQALYYTSSGKHDFVIRHSRYPMLSAGEGYRAHLQVLHYLIQQEIYGSSLITDEKIIEALAAENPNNPAIQLAAGNGNAATRILLTKFPEGRLPTSSDWCGVWFNEQAQDAKGLIPCPEESNTHSGGDFLFVARRLLQ